MRRSICSWAGVAVAGELQSTQKQLEDAIAANSSLIAERRDTERQLRERNLFLGSLSHELRAPLNAIIGFAEILASGSLASDSPKREAFAEHIHKSGRHLLRLINDVLQLSKVDAGVYQFSPEPVKTCEVIASVADLLHTRIVRKGLLLSVEVEPELAEIVVDPGSLKQALLNHLAHAADVASDGSGIAVRARPHGHERFRLEVRIPPSSAANEASVMGAEHAMDSNNLNLTLARRLVEAQGGEVGQSFDRHQGATWYLVLNRLYESSGVSEDGSHRDAAKSTAKTASG